MKNLITGATLTNKKNGSTATITNISETGAITILENGKERAVTEKTLKNYYRVTSLPEADAQPVEAVAEPAEEKAEVIDIAEKAEAKKSKAKTKTADDDGTIKDLEALKSKSIVLGLNLHQTESDIKKSRAYVIGEDGKHIIKVVYGKRASGKYIVRAKDEFTGSEYHEKWAPASRYERKDVSLDGVFEIVREFLNK